MNAKCPCGGIILADTEDWDTPLCHECWVPLTRLDIPALQREKERLRDALTKIERAWSFADCKAATPLERKLLFTVRAALGEDQEGL